MFWTDAWSLGASMWRNALALQETAQASHGVIDHRAKLIDAAFRNPLEADLAELGRMVPEKVAAFSEAGAAMMEGWLGLQADYLAQMRDMASIAVPGTRPAATLDRIGRRATRIGKKASRSAGRALAPVHAAATANDRRLRKARAKPVKR